MHTAIFTIQDDASSLMLLQADWDAITICQIQNGSESTS